MTRCILLPTIAISLMCNLATARAGSTKSDEINKLLDAIAHVESNGNAEAVGDSGRALGTYQIHKYYWRDGTRFLGVDWSYDQAKDPVKAREVVRAYLLHYGKGKTLIQKARIHNGGPRGYRKRATLAYARRIAKVLEHTDNQS